MEILEVEVKRIRIRVKGKPGGATEYFQAKIRN